MDKYSISFTKYFYLLVLEPKLKCRFYVLLSEINELINLTKNDEAKFRLNEIYGIYNLYNKPDQVPTITLSPTLALHSIQERQAISVLRFLDNRSKERTAKALNRKYSLEIELAFSSALLSSLLPIDYFTAFLEGIVPHTGQTNASRYVFAKLVSEFKKVLKMGQHSIKIKRGEVMCGRKVLLAIGERGTALSPDFLIYYSWILKKEAK